MIHQSELYKPRLKRHLQQQRLAPGRLIQIQHPIQLTQLTQLWPFTQLKQTQQAYTRNNNDTLRNENTTDQPLKPTTLQPKTTPPTPQLQSALNGGLGGLGLRAGSWLVDHSAALTLTSRSGLVARDDQGLARMLEALVIKGDARTLVCDVGDCVQMQACWSASAICGVLHAAGVSTKRALLHVNLAELNTAYTSKALAASHIHLAAASVLPDTSIMISSVSSFWCRAGQASYASANGYLDAHSYARRAQGQPAACLSLRKIGSAN